MTYFVVPESDFIYWADSDHGSITRIRRDGTDRKVVVEHYESMETIPMDWLTGKQIEVLKELCNF